MTVLWSPVYQATNGNWIYERENICKGIICKSGDEYVYKLNKDLRIRRKSIHELKQVIEDAFA